MSNTTPQISRYNNATTQLPAQAFANDPSLRHGVVGTAHPPRKAERSSFSDYTAKRPGADPAGRPPSQRDNGAQISNRTGRHTSRALTR